MYRYELMQTINGVVLTEDVYSSQHYSKAGFSKVVKKAVVSLMEADIELPEKKRMEIVKRELANNYEFVSVTNNRINCDLTNL